MRYVAAELRHLPASRIGGCAHRSAVGLEAVAAGVGHTLNHPRGRDDRLREVPHGDRPRGREQLLALQERLGGNVPRGASEAQLAAIPVRTVAEGMAEETCSICLSAQEPGERLRVMPCGHTHHAACLERWLQTSRKCPVCRHELE